MDITRMDAVLGARVFYPVVRVRTLAGELLTEETMLAAASAAPGSWRLRSLSYLRSTPTDRVKPRGGAGPSGTTPGRAHENGEFLTKPVLLVLHPTAHLRRV